MGGKAFGRQAQRMSTPQLQNLTDHCLDALQDIFLELKPLRHYSSKESHGDLDIICAWRGIKLGQFTKTGGRGSVSHQDTERDWSQVTCDSHLEDFDRWCEMVASKVNATEWTRFNYETPVLSLMMPCEVIEKDNEDNARPKGHATSDSIDGIQEGDPFYQVDLLLVPPESLHLAHFLASGGAAITLLFAALRALSPSLTLQTTYLSICCSPRHNSRPIRVILTSSVEQICHWLGLDLDIWQNGFKDEQAFRRWISNPARDGILRQAWKRVVSGHPTTPGAGKRRRETWQNFKGWLDDAVLLQEHRQGGFFCLEEVGSGESSFLRSRLGQYKKHETEVWQAEASFKEGMEICNADEYTQKALKRWKQQQAFETSMVAAKQAAKEGLDARKQRNRIKADARWRRSLPLFQQDTKILIRLPGQNDVFEVERTQSSQ